MSKNDDLPISHEFFRAEEAKILRNWVHLRMYGEGTDHEGDLYYIRRKKRFYNVAYCSCGWMHTELDDTTVHTPELSHLFDMLEAHCESRKERT